MGHENHCASLGLGLRDETAGLEHAEVEHQHELLTDTLHRFVELVRHRDRRLKAVSFLRGLVTEIGMHFGYEESLMAKSGYPDFDHHLRQHLGMMTELGLILDRLEDLTDESNVLRQVDLLIDWYQHHVDVSDYKFANWMAR